MSRVEHPDAHDVIRARDASWILAPRDGFFAKDGRGWFTSASGRARSLHWPWPTTIRGALRAAWGRQLEASRGAPLDQQAWLAETEGVALGISLPVLGPAGKWQAGHRMWPVPADAFYVGPTDDDLDARVRRLEPRPPSDDVTVKRFGSTAERAVQALWRPAVPDAKPAGRPEWWTDAEFTAWCRGEPVPAHGADARAARAPRRRTEVRLKIEPETHTAADGFLFSTELTEADTADGRAWAVATRLQAPANAGVTLDGALTFLGGKRRLARLDPAGRDLFEAPSDVEPSVASGIRLYVITPAHFERGWLPDGFDEVDGELRGELPPLDGDFVLRAAIVGRPVAVGGWDMASHRPKAIRRLVPAGSVYYLQRPDGRPITAAERRDLWLAAAQQPEDSIADGLGRVVAAPWHPRPNRESV